MVKKPLYDKRKYWEWRAENNPFDDPYRKGYKPGYFENAPGRRILLIYIPMMIASVSLMQWYVKKEASQGRGVIAVPYAVLKDEPMRGPFDW